MAPDLERKLLAGFVAEFDFVPDLIARAPGRVNIIGEHTDYNDGFALPVALGVETGVALRPRSDGRVRVVALDYSEKDNFTVDTVPQRHGRGWRDYVRGTIAILLQAGIPLVGADIAISGNIPKGTGLSSSASLEVSLAAAALTAAGRDYDLRKLALWAQKAENDFVGVRCGNLDQLCAAASVAGSALLIDCRSLELTPVPVPSDASVLIVQSGVTRGLLGGEYNARRAQCEEAAETLGVAALRDANMDMLDDARSKLSDLVYRRARHVITENERTLKAAEALEANDLRALGTLMRESHQSQRDDFGITVAETDRLVELLQEAIGFEGGARQTGGGFGGAVVAMLPRARADEAADLVRRSYRTPDGSTPSVHIDSAHQGVSVAVVKRHGSANTPDDGVLACLA